MFDSFCKNFTEVKMEKYRYGPLIFVTKGMDERRQLFLERAILLLVMTRQECPIDKNGFQCVDILCPLHPSYEPTETEFNNILNQCDLPTLASYRQWFDDNFLIVSR